MLIAMAYALGAKEAVSGNGKDLHQIVLTQIKEQEVKLLIFDEFTHVVEDRTEKFAGKAVRGLKELLGENVCQCVFVGTEQLQALHGIYGQFRRRSSGDFIMYPFDWGDATDKAEWINIMNRLQEKLPMKFSSPLGSADMALKMHLATGGLLDHLMKLIFRATSYAYDDGLNLVSDASLSLAFERLRRGDKKRNNPFGPSSRSGREIGFLIDKVPVDDEPKEKDDDVTNLIASQKPKPTFQK